MEKQFYFNLLILSTVFAQGIADLWEDRNIKKSSELHIRKKRIIDKTRNGNRAVQLSMAPYIVNILKNGESTCAGSIMNPQIILTTAHCLSRKYELDYKILSGSNSRRHGTSHNITQLILHPDYSRFGGENNLVLLKIAPPIDFHQSLNREIELHQGELNFENMYGTFSGWGCTSKQVEPGSHKIQFEYPDALRITRLPIITNEECILTDHGISSITEKHICTLDRSIRRGTCCGDEGGPLVYEDRLIGVMSYRRGIFLGQMPDIFINVNHHEHRVWIDETIETLNAPHI